MSSEPELGLVVAYLAALRAELADMPNADRFLAEAEAHLREATARATAHRLTIDNAQRAAIERFGSVRAVADAARDMTGKPVIHDARAGLPQPTLGHLRRASQLGLAMKDGRTAVFGYWIGELFAGAILVRRRDARGDLATVTGIPARTLQVRDCAAWRNLIVPELHPGMHIHAEVWAGVPRLWFGPIRQHSVPLLPGSQISLAFPAPGSHLQRLRHAGSSS